MNRKEHSGFSLVELLIVVVILGILAAAVIPRFTLSAAEAKANTCGRNKSHINIAVERWNASKGAWPAADLSDISADTDYFPEGIPTCPVDGSAYALGANNRVSGHAH